MLNTFFGKKEEHTDNVKDNVNLYILSYSIIIW